MKYLFIFLSVWAILPSFNASAGYAEDKEKIKNYCGKVHLDKTRVETLPGNYYQTPTAKFVTFLKDKETETNYYLLCGFQYGFKHSFNDLYRKSFELIEGKPIDEKKLEVLTDKFSEIIYNDPHTVKYSLLTGSTEGYKIYFDKKISQLKEKLKK